MNIIVFILGLIMGSFLNVVVLRLKTNEKFVKGRSHCDKCDHILKWYENIPLLSYVFLFGKCSKCKQNISFQNPLVELATGILFFITYLNIFNGLNILFLIFYLIIVSFLIIIFIYDLKYYLILDKVSIPAIVIVFLFQLLFLILGYQSFNNFLFVILSGVIGGGWFALQFFLSKGKWVGGGDIRLGFLMGLVLGWPGILVALGLAYVGGTIILLPFVLVKKKKMKSQIPFGTFLVPATIAVMFWQVQIIEYYLSIFYI
jgi:prepilin signal peptidase PulO-like enzyme (type II secretory pathway)